MARLSENYSHFLRVERLIGSCDGAEKKRGEEQDLVLVGVQSIRELKR